jgi:hypothetical protein
MQDWTAGQLRYLIHLDDGGSGMRVRYEPLEAGCELDDGGVRYVVVRVEPPAARALAERGLTDHRRAVRHRLRLARVEKSRGVPGRGTLIRAPRPGVPEFLPCIARPG